MMTVQVTLFIAEHADHAKVLAELCDLGLLVDRSDEDLGFVVGRCEEGKLAALQTVPGVSAVTRGRQFQLPDPDSPVQ